MRYFILLLISVCTLHSNAQLDFPKWLMPDTLGQYVAIHGFMSSAKDSIPTEGEISIIKHGGKDMIYRFSCDIDGRFDLFLPANGHYSVKFEKKGHIMKVIDVFTSNVPKRAWKNTFALDLNAYMEVMPQGFDVSVSRVPFNIAKYDEEMKFFVFDEEFEKLRRISLDNEIKRCNDILAVSKPKI
jgi:hypothetical protein